MSPVTGVPCNWMVTGSLGSRGRAEEVEYILEGLDCIKVTAGNGTVETLSVRIKGQINNVDVIVGVYCRPPIQDNDVNEFFFEELRDTSKSTALVLMWDFNLPDTNWEHHTAGTTWARRFQKNLNESCMEQALRKMTQKDALLDLLLVHRVDFMIEVGTGCCLSHSDHEEIEIKISVDRRKSASKTSTLDMRRENLRLLRELRYDRPRKFQCSELEGHNCKNDQLPVDPEIVQDLLLQLDPSKSVVPDGIHSRILIITNPLLMIFEQSWKSGEVADWKRVNIVWIFKKGKKEDPRNYRAVSLAPVPDD
ncbi:hypothetical protein BTVI_132244 [Pitangus sulphuratus]|nr:hypothetical protein BTVI_132244 [Pitangus sulphuratus]